MSLNPFEADPLISAKVERLLLWVGGMERGAFFPHSEIERVAKVHRYGEHWAAVLDRFRRELLKRRGIALVSEHGQGYRLATKDEQLLALPEAHCRAASRKHGKAIKELSSIRPNELGVHDNNIRTQLIESSRKARSEERQRVGLIRAIFGRREKAKRGKGARLGREKRHRTGARV